MVWGLWGGCEIGVCGVGWVVLLGGGVLLVFGWVVVGRVGRVGIVVVWVWVGCSRGLVLVLVRTIGSVCLDCPTSVLGFWCMVGGG